jgi:hypothetical protein
MIITPFGTPGIMSLMERRLLIRAPGRSMEFVKDNVLPMELPGEVVIKEA